MTLAGAGGVVKYNGSPLSGATITFVPENGPLATAVTDLSGNFKLSTGGQSGAPVGPCKVTVAAFTGDATPAGGAADLSKPPSSAEEGAARARKMTEMMRGGGSGSSESGATSKSIIPEKYSKADSSGLNFTIDKDASKNQFTIDLK